MLFKDVYMLRKIISAESDQETIKMFEQAKEKVSIACGIDLGKLTLCRTIGYDSESCAALAKPIPGLVILFEPFTQLDELSRMHVLLHEVMHHANFRQVYPELFMMRHVQTALNKVHTGISKGSIDICEPIREEKIKFLEGQLGVGSSCRFKEYYQAVISYLRKWGTAEENSIDAPDCGSPDGENNMAAMRMYTREESLLLMLFTALGILDRENHLWNKELDSDTEEALTHEAARCLSGLSADEVGYLPQDPGCRRMFLMVERKYQGDKDMFFPDFRNRGIVDLVATMLKEKT